MLSLLILDDLYRNVQCAFSCQIFVFIFEGILNVLGPSHSMNKKSCLFLV